MSRNFYDAVVLGLGLPSLLSAGLLGKRGFRVLVVANGQPRPSYELDGVRLLREPFLLPAHDSPALSRVFHELALRPLMRRRVAPLAPALQAVTPKHRLDFSADPERFGHEIEREFPAVRRAADDFIRGAARAWDAVNQLLEHDLVWPPETFLERRQHARAALHNPFWREAQGGALLAELPDDHALRQMVALVLAFAEGGQVAEGSVQQRLRLFAAELRSAALLEGDYTGLFELLVGSIRTHNGEVRFADRVERILVRRGRIEGVVISPRDEQVGCHFVLSGLPVSKLVRLLSERGELDAMLDEVGAPRPHRLRYTLNLIAHRDAVSEGMGQNLLLLPRDGGAASGAGLRVRTHTTADGARAVFQVEALLPVQAGQAPATLVGELRERLLSELSQLLPFLHPHLHWIDSPHDGRPPFDVRSGSEAQLDDPWTRGPGFMRMMYSFPRGRLHGATALPLRTPIRRLLLCSDQVIPGLGLEGQFLVASSCARVVTRSLGRGWMNRGRWTKVDL